MTGRKRVEISTPGERRSGGKVAAARNVSTSRDRRGDGAGGVGRRRATSSRPASTNPQSPNDGTSTWYGAVASPAERTVASTHQNAWRANDGEPPCTTIRPGGLRVAAAMA